MRCIVLFLLTACSARTAAPDTPAMQAPLPEPLAAFEGVVAHTGEARTVEDLRGQPTVVWFFPYAGSPA